MKYSAIWPNSGTLRNGSCKARGTWAPPISGSGSSSSPAAERMEAWATPQAMDASGKAANKRGNPMLSGQAEGTWPTPTAESYGTMSSGYRDAENPGVKKPSLNTAARQWPTPTSIDQDFVGSNDTEESRLAKGKQPTLAHVVRSWPTPRASDEKGAAPERKGWQLREEAATWTTPMANDHGHTSRRVLSDQAQTWPTPNAGVTPNSHGRRGGRPGNSHQSGNDLDAMAEAWPTPKTPSGGPESRESKASRGSGGGDLLSAAETWPTPTANKSTYQNSHGKEYATLPGMTERWPTPRAADGKVSGHPSGLRHRQEFGDVMLSDAAETWPTPRAEEAAHPGRKTNAGGQEQLTVAATTWPTPRASLPYSRQESVGGRVLEQEAQEWPNPSRSPSGPEATKSSDARTATGDGTSPDTASTSPDSKSITRRSWPTARAEDAENAGNHPGKTDSLTGAAKSMMTLDSFRSPGEGSPIGRPDPRRESDGPRSSPSGPISRRHWPTPAALDAAGFPGKPDEGRTSPNSGKTLSGATEIEWQTPSAGEFKWRRQAGQEERAEPLLPAQAEMVSREASPPTEEPRPKMRLNPKMVCWLMGWPENWCDPMTPVSPQTFAAWRRASEALLAQICSESWGTGS